MSRQRRRTSALARRSCSAEAFGHLSADADRRIERDHRFLEHHADGRPAQRAQLPRRQLSRGLCRRARFARRRAASREARDRARRGPRPSCRCRTRRPPPGIRRVRCANETSSTTAASRSDGLDAQIFDGQQRAVIRSAILGSRRSRRESPSRLMPSSVSAMHRPGAMTEPGGGLHDRAGSPPACCPRSAPAAARRGPRKLSALSASSTQPNMLVASTATGARLFGSTCRSHRIELPNCR